MGEPATTRVISEVSGDRPRVRDLVVPLSGFVTAILPLFLAGSLASEMRADLHLTTGRLGVAVAGFFVAGALTSVPLGWVGERLGAGRSLRIGAALSAVVMCSIALFVQSSVPLAGALAVGGAAQALVDPAASLYLANTVNPRALGFAMGVKGAAIPVATLICGLALPAIAVPFGWRWAYAMGAVAALGAMLSAPKGEPVGRRASGHTKGAAMGRLFVLASGVAAASAAASTVATFLVDSAVHAGVSSGLAGALTAVGGAAGVVARVTSGVRADRRPTGQLREMRRLLLAGTVVLLFLAWGTPIAFVVGIPVAFVTAWGWPVLLQLAVVRRHPEAPSAATGVVNTGAFIGAVAGPLLFGWLAEGSYAIAWSVSAAWSFVAVLVIAVADRTFGNAVTAP